MWFVAALLSPVFHGFANILDNYFVSHIFKRVTTFTFFSAFFNFLFLPIVILISVPHIPPLALVPYFILLGLIDVLYTIPYYKALQEEDTSVVTSLFSIGHIFVPILAWFFVGEQLTAIQYFGFFIIIIASASLTLNWKARFKFNKAFFYMLLVSFLLALEIVIYKYIFQSVDWSTGFVWSVVCSFIFASFLLFFNKTRADIKENLGNFKKRFPLFAAEEFFTFGGSAAATFAISLAPVTFVKAVGATQAFFVVIYALILGKIFPKLFRENIDKKSVLRKFLMFILIAIGVSLVLL